MYRIQNTLVQFYSGQPNLVHYLIVFTTRTNNKRPETNYSVVKDEAGDQIEKRTHHTSIGESHTMFYFKQELLK